MWFGNFFEPFYSDFDATRRGIDDVASLGFNNINLDSKPWEDFFARYRGEEASQYVAMQEFMISQAGSRGMTHTCLALYLCGDNLYPSIRDVPPVWGEQAVRVDGDLMGTYKYWSPRAQATMVEHVQGLLRLYGDGMYRRDDGSVVVQTMFDPIPKPSFDPEGRAKYLTWLESHYEGDISSLNERYGTSAGAFGDLAPDEYWLRPQELDWVGCALPSRDDFERRSGDFHRWVDNQRHLAHVLDEHLATMVKQWHGLEPDVYVEPVLHQWGYFFNPPGQLDWQTGQRALDVYRCADYVDGVLFMAAPLNSENRADAMALSVDSTIARCANGGRPFTGGLYLGRHVNTDIYRVVPPAEAIATHVVNGATALHVYGYSGLDDGGVMFRMDSTFKDSLRAGTEWAKAVMPQLDAPRTKEVALLFPEQMSLLEPLSVDEGGRHRMDLLGWYQQFVDLGWHVDIVHPRQVVAGALRDYQHLVVPTDSLYDLGDNDALEAAVREFVSDGGTLFHGPGCRLAQAAFGVLERPVPYDCIRWTEDVIPHGWSTVAYDSGEPIAPYIQSGDAAFARIDVGDGQVFSFGFEYGYAYSTNVMPIVPTQYGKAEMHPVVLLEHTPVEVLAGTSPRSPLHPVKGVESARFGDKVVIVNHRSSPVALTGMPAGEQVHMVPAPHGWLAAHSAVLVQTATHPDARPHRDRRASN
ncbi:hypothetical protein [Phycicoccus sp. Soil803]|uniref:hypothetical protein n=1 Tax=Phycicoccus sp. Soil803 TaxID=1736415 RepID=UPI00070B030B|nr:hypothetical protein [Phycicoccus sp. Soil803]KRF26515.1 hypothetical protein ASG95_20300 [Phycicoccus sp. Soil803]